MYPYEQEVDVTIKIKIAIVVFKICLCIGLFFLGVHVTFWTIDTLNQLINNPENVALVKNFIELQSNDQIVDIVINKQKIFLRDNGIAKWIILIFIFIILFNVIGRIISGIFSSMASIVSNLDISTLKSDKEKK